MNLLEAARCIAQTEMAVMMQIVEIDKLRVAGRDIAVAERILLAFVESLKAPREHRALIAQTIAQVENAQSAAEDWVKSAALT